MSAASDAAKPTALSPGGTDAVGRILGLLGDEWTLLIIQHSLLGATRYGEFMERLPISNSVLTNRLRAPTLTCRSCAEVVTEREVAARWGPSGSWPRSVPEAVTRRRSTTEDNRGQAGLFPATMSVFGNRWAAALLVCAFLGTSRFTDFQTQLGAPPSLLAGRLQTFCANGVLCVARQTG